MAGSYSALYYHIIFSTKERFSWLTQEYASRVHQYLGGVHRGVGGLSISVGGSENHVHLLGSIMKNIAVADFLRMVKTDSSRWIHTTFPALRHFSWQEGYAAFTVSPGEIDEVKRYIDGQAVHHRTQSFQEELLDFFHRYQVKYDDRYIWK